MKHQKQKKTNRSSRSRYWECFDHIVLIVLENRSFNSIVGTLPHVEGIRGQDLVYHLAPESGAPTELLQHSFRPHSSTVIGIPHVDPNEEYPDLYECFTGKPWTFDSPQLNTFPHLPMSGFLTNYYKALKENDPDFLKQSLSQQIQQLSQVVNVLSSSQVPIFHRLAQEFALADHYFCDVPSCTLPNRAFLQSAQSNGNVTNGNYYGLQSWVVGNSASTLFDLLHEHNISWKVYYDRHNVLPLSCVISFPRTASYKSQFVTMETFFQDVQNHTLPAFTLLEPRFLSYPEDCHPLDSDSFPNHNSISASEHFLFRVYEALRQSGLQDRTLVLLTFDEGGGLADHVPPPRQNIPTPYPVGFPTEMNFNFKALGQRVPLVMIHSYSRKQKVFHRNLQHTSIIRSLCKKFQIKKFLSPRDRDAPLLPNIGASIGAHFGKKRKPRCWPPLEATSLYSTWLPETCVLRYQVERYMVDLVTRYLQEWLFQQQSVSSLRQEAYTLLQFLSVWHCCKKHFESIFNLSGCLPQPKIRFYGDHKKKPRILSSAESLHAARCKPASFYYPLIEGGSRKEQSVFEACNCQPLEPSMQTVEVCSQEASFKDQ